MARNSETVAAAIEAVNTIISEQNAALKALKDTLSQKAAGGGSVNPIANALPPLPEHSGLEENSTLINEAQELAESLPDASGGTDISLSNVEAFVVDFSDKTSYTILNGAYHGTKRAVVN